MWAALSLGNARMGRPFRWSSRSGEMKSNDKLFFTGFIRDLTERQKTEGTSPGIAGRTRAYLPSDRDGGDGVHACARAESAFVGDLELSQGASRVLDNPTDGSQSLIARGARQGRRDNRCVQDKSSTGFATLSPAESLSARQKSLSKLLEEASALALVGARDQGRQGTVRA